MFVVCGVRRSCTKTGADHAIFGLAASRAKGGRHWWGLGGALASRAHRARGFTRKVKKRPTRPRPSGTGPRGISSPKDAGAQRVGVNKAGMLNCGHFGHRGPAITKNSPGVQIRQFRHLFFEPANFPRRGTVPGQGARGRRPRFLRFGRLPAAGASAVNGKKTKVKGGTRYAHSPRFESGNRGKGKGKGRKGNLFSIGQRLPTKKFTLRGYGPSVITARENIAQLFIISGPKPAPLPLKVTFRRGGPQPPGFVGGPNPPLKTKKHGTDLCET